MDRLAWLSWLIGCGWESVFISLSHQCVPFWRYRFALTLGECEPVLDVLDDGDQSPIARQNVAAKYWQIQIFCWAKGKSVIERMIEHCKNCDRSPLLITVNQVISHIFLVSLVSLVSFIPLVSCFSFVSCLPWNLMSLISSLPPFLSWEMAKDVTWSILHIFHVCHATAFFTKQRKSIYCFSWCTWCFGLCTSCPLHCDSVFVTFSIWYLLCKKTSYMEVALRTKLLKLHWTGRFRATKAA